MKFEGMKRTLILAALLLISAPLYAVDLPRAIAWDEHPSYASAETRPDYYEVRCGVDAPGTTAIKVLYGTNTATCSVTYDPAEQHTLNVAARACRDGDLTPELKCSPDATLTALLPMGLDPPQNIRIEFQGVASINANDLRTLLGSLGGK